MHSIYLLENDPDLSKLIADYISSNYEGSIICTSYAGELIRKIKNDPDASVVIITFDFDTEKNAEIATEIKEINPRIVTCVIGSMQRDRVLFSKNKVLFENLDGIGTMISQCIESREGQLSRVSNHTEILPTI